jgi:hypothetical protein
VSVPRKSEIVCFTRPIGARTSGIVRRLCPYSDTVKFLSLRYLTYLLFNEGRRDQPGLERKALTNAVRSLFGFSRTGTNLDLCIGAAIDELLAKQIIGEGSTGICLKR